MGGGGGGTQRAMRMHLRMNGPGVSQTAERGREHAAECTHASPGWSSAAVQATKARAPLACGASTLPAPPPAWPLPAVPASGAATRSLMPQRTRWHIRPAARTQAASTPANASIPRAGALRKGSQWCGCLAGQGSSHGRGDTSALEQRPAGQAAALPHDPRTHQRRCLQLCQLSVRQGLH